MAVAALQALEIDVRPAVVGEEAVEAGAQGVEHGLDRGDLAVRQARAMADQDDVADHAACSSCGSKARLPRTRSLAFSPIMIVGALVFDDGTRGMIEESQTRRPSRPRTRRSGSTTAISPVPMAQAPDGMVVGLAGAEGVLGQLLVGGEVRGRAAHGHQERPQGRLLHDLARHPQALQRHAAVVGIGPVVGVDQGRVGRIAALEPDGAARARAQEGGVEREAGVLQLLDAGLDARAEAEVELDVGLRGATGRRTRSRRSRRGSRRPGRA